MQKVLGPTPVRGRLPFVAVVACISFPMQVLLLKCQSRKRKFDNQKQKKQTVEWLNANEPYNENALSKIDS